MTEKQAELAAKKQHKEMRHVIVQKRSAFGRLKADYNEIERTLKHLRHSMTVLCSLRSVVGGLQKTVNHKSPLL